MVYQQAPNLASYMRDITERQDYLLEARKLPGEEPKETRSRLNKKLGRAIQRYRQGLNNNRQTYKRSKRELTDLNLHLVVSIAKGYQGNGVSIEDLIQEGNKVLIEKIVETFDPDHDTEEHPEGYELGTHAIYWLKQAMGRAIADEMRGNQTITYNTCSSRKKIDESRISLTQKLGREPTDKEVADYCNKTFYPKRKEPIKPEHVESLVVLESSQRITSSENIDGKSSDALASQDKSPQEQAMHNEKLEIIIELLNNGLFKKDPREREVLKHYFGIQGYEALNLTQIGEKYGVSRERIRQIKVKALRKMREAILTGYGELA